MNYKGRVRRCGLVIGGMSLGVGFDLSKGLARPQPSLAPSSSPLFSPILPLLPSSPFPSPLLPLSLLPVDQDLKLSVTALHYRCWPDDHGL